MVGSTLKYGEIQGRSRSASSPRTDLTIFVPSLGGGGAQRSLLLLARGLCDRVERLDLVTANASGHYGDLVPDGVRLVDLAASRMRRAYGPLTRYLRSERPRGLVTSLLDASLIAIASRRRAAVDTRIVLRLASVVSRETAAMTRMPRLAWRAASAIGFRDADTLVAVSRGVADDASQMLRLSRSRVQVIPGPHLPSDLDKLAAESIKNDPWLAPGAPPVVLSVGRLAAVKNLAHLLRGFAGLRRPAHLLLLGEGPDRNPLESLAHELGIAERVRFDGFRVNPFPYMKRAAVYALTSRFEGMPGALCQAMALGCPVVAVDCPYGPRDALRDGELGRLVPDGDVDALTAALDRVLQERPDTGPAQAAARRFDLSSIADAYLQLLSPDLPSC